MASAADVPGIYDVVINGEGYIFANQVDPNIPFRTQRAKYGISPTFVTRQNVSGAYGDNQQDFWMTASQNDWSLGEQQRFLRVNDEQSKRRYWVGSNINTIWVPGQATLRTVTNSKVPAAAVSVIGRAPGGGFFMYSATNQYEMINGVVATDGAHGLGTTPSRNAIVSDGNRTYISAGTTSLVRRCSSSVWTSFNATQGVDCLAFLNNTLFGAKGSVLYKYDSAGAVSTVFTWTGVDASSGGQTVIDLCPFGGKLAVLVQVGETYQIWLADSSTASVVAELAPDFKAQNLSQVNGVLFISGVTLSQTNTRQAFSGTVYYFANGSPGRLWQSKFNGTGFHCCCAPLGEGLVITDDAAGTILYYDMANGGVSTIGAFTPPIGTTHDMATDRNGAVAVVNGTTTVADYGDSITTISTGYLITSLFDFDSSLDKYIKAIKLDFELDTVGNGGSVDIAYQLNGLEGAYTSLQVGAVAGTEYNVNTQARSISVKVTLNKGTSTYGPILKRIYVRAAPIQQAFRNDEFIIDATGRNGKGMVQLRNGNSHRKDGFQQAIDIRSVVLGAVPVSVTDRFSTYNAVIDAATLDMVEVNPEEFFIRFSMREV